ncbi:coiled-coil domain-containing protein 28A isoform X2 [Diabrotica virgifera virgifera]|uniref:Coiled-coil domain-containing protein 28A n=1 Tax=Diabrotica virgifera virgifera TaxID=50390 RepID=A0ABM5K4N9_DIAVI|nr:coiled-coil domain-containing protein 28A isoform X2 [Diabrotica virgifera virgifera]
MPRLGTQLSDILLQFPNVITENKIQEIDDEFYREMKLDSGVTNLQISSSSASSISGVEEFWHSVSLLEANDGKLKYISSSGNTSHSSVVHSARRAGSGTAATGSKITFVNERKVKEGAKPTTVRARNPHKENPHNSDTPHHSFISQVPDVRHMERALLGLLADFHSGKLRAFGSGCTMEQMTNIREQQEKLAKLHFDLASATVPSLNEEDIQKSQSTMSQLIQRLEQLSDSIEGLHNTSNK